MYKEQKYIVYHFMLNLNSLVNYLNFNMKLNTSNSLIETNLNVPCIEAMRKRVDSW